MEQCINAGLTIAECTRAAATGRADGIGWIVPLILLLGVMVLAWEEANKKHRQD